VSVSVGAIVWPVESVEDGLAAADSSPAELMRVGAAEPEVVRESLDGAQAQVRQLLVALEHRTVTGQATGIIMERFDLSAEEAFGVLVRLSQEQNVKLYDVACSLTQTGQVPGLRRPD
jgi:hypothetical protein